MKFDTLDALDNSKYEWNIKDSYSTKGKREFKGRNLLLLDDKHKRMHAFIWPNYLQEFKNSFDEGKIYAIRNFAVKSYRKESLRCIKSDKQIWLSNYTKVSLIWNDEKSEKMIRQNEFDFFDLGEIADMIKQEANNHLIDIIGVLKDRDVLRHFTNQNQVEQRSIKFTLTDGNSSIKLCFWDDFGKSFDDALNKEIENPIVIIVAGGKLNDYNGEPYVSNVAATRFYVNSDHCSRKVMCQVIVKTVKDNMDWNYRACTSCHEEVEFIDLKFKCQTCKRIVPFPDMRFRLCLVVEDATGGAAIILNDREVGNIVGRTVYDVITEQQRENEATDEFPKCLKLFEGKQYTITILLNEDNINRGSNTYLAVDISEGFEINEKNASEDDDSYGGFKISQSSAQSVAKEDNLKTPDTKKSANTKKVRRMNNEEIITITELDDENDDTGLQNESLLKRKKGSDEAG
ncbi:hypothetical protein DCAR_0623414 [Daucus carota subsp. sativus]|uniref:Replication factor A C-terminal domain-containing protein n=1 Tax=Daucus carota subsp. sativus TaxID=79200 RepID=A0A164V787_DAUCS|nr:hypothetical protein DCAR_0623414 [Daucus carota subsp. sativus]